MALDESLDVRTLRIPELMCECIKKETKRKIKFDLFSAKQLYRRQHIEASKEGWTKTQRTLETMIKETDLLIKEFERIKECP